VFTIKYLRSFGYDVKNDLFAEHSWYFRNALVRANFRDQTNGIEPTLEYLNRFFDNLLLGERNELKNRFLHIRYKEMFPVNDTLKKTDVTDNVTDSVTDRTSKIIALIKENSHISTAKIAVVLSVSKRTILRDIDKFKQSGQIRREGDEKTGHWKIIMEGGNNE
jgi:predicted HTH transcriptional regulator